MIKNSIIGNNVVVQDGAKIGLKGFGFIPLKEKNFRFPHIGRVILKNNVELGANCTIVCGNTIGKYSFIGAGAVVTKNVKPFALMVGVPAKQIGWISCYGDKIDLNLDGKNSWTCPHTGKIYLLYKNQLLVK